MKTIVSAKRLTFSYFSIVAVSIISIYAIVFNFTTNDIESLYANNRMANITAYVKQGLIEYNTATNPIIELQTQGKVAFEPLIKIYFDEAQLHSDIPAIPHLPYDDPEEIHELPNEQVVVISKTRVQTQEGERDAFIVMDNSLYELSEEQLIYKQFLPIIFSIALLLLSLYTVLKIAEILTRPISHFAKSLAERSPNDLSPIELPKGKQSKELHKLVKTFNAYQGRIANFIQRERSYSRYLSHELRSPLMVIKGVISLLGESQEPEFVKKQNQRLAKAQHEMEEFIETLLGLSRSLQIKDISSRQLSAAEVQSIIDSQLDILANKPVTLNLNIQHLPKLIMPEAALQIALGNILKNAFSYTHEGQISIEINSDYIQVVDSGEGLKHKSTEPQGHGLGLLLVRDICQQYHYSFELMDNRDFPHQPESDDNASASGCRATIYFSANKLNSP